MSKILFSFLMLCSFNAFGQRHYIEFPTNQFQVEENNFYSYNYTIHSFPYSAPTRLDTLNNCRVRKNKIKSVTIYQFYSATDSAYVSTVEYDTLGLTKYMQTLFSSNEIKCINCDSISPKKNRSNKTTRRREFQFNERWRTNSDGYIVEYKRKNRGLLSKILGPMIGVSNIKIKYTYDSLYLSVTETVYFRRKGRFTEFHEDGTSTCYKYNLNSKGDLLSEFNYRKEANGELALISGYTYHYEYY